MVPYNVFTCVVIAVSPRLYDLQRKLVLMKRLYSWILIAVDIKKMLYILRHAEMFLLCGFYHGTLPDHGAVVSISKSLNEWNLEYPVFVSFGMFTRADHSMMLRCSTL